jgi:CRISPR-associated protein Csn2
MRVLKHKEIDQDILLSKDKFYNLVIENPLFLRNYLLGIKNQIANAEPYLLFYDNDKETELGKVAYVIDNPWAVELDEKKESTLIQKDIASHINQQQKEDYEVLVNAIEAYLKGITYDYSLPLAFDEDISLPNLLKLVSVTAAQENPSFLEGLILSIKKIAFLSKANLFFLVNLHDWLSQKEMAQFVESMRSLELDFVLLSSHLPTHPDSSESIIHIDEDLCEIPVEAKTRKD